MSSHTESVMGTLRGGDVSERGGEGGARNGEDGARSGEDGTRSGEGGARSGEDGARSGEDGARSGDDGARSGDDGAREAVAVGVLVLVSVSMHNPSGFDDPIIGVEAISGVIFAGVTGCFSAVGAGLPCFRSCRLRPDSRAADPWHLITCDHIDDLVGVIHSQNLQ